MCKKKEQKKEALILALADPANYKRKRTELYEELGFSKSTFYELAKDEEVAKGVRELVERHTDAALAVAYQELIRIMQCKDDNEAALEAIKLFFEIKGRYDPKGSQGGGMAGGGVVILPQPGISYPQLGDDGWKA